jgi:hypothetical protein
LHGIGVGRRDDGEREAGKGQSTNDNLHSGGMLTSAAEILR